MEKMHFKKVFLLISFVFFFIFSTTYALGLGNVGEEFAVEAEANMPSFSDATDSLVPDACDTGVDIPNLASMVESAGEGLVSEAVPVTDSAVQGQLAKLNCHVKKVKNQEKRQSIWEQIFNGDILPLLSTIGKQIARDLVIDLTDSTVNWINGGYNGQPAYASNPLAFAARSADLSVGDFIYNNPDLNALCSSETGNINFQGDVKLQLSLAYSPATSQFTQRSGCTLSGVAQNFVGDLTTVANQIKNVDLNNWSNWIEVTAQPQNTEVGAYFIAKQQLDKRISDAKDVTEKKLAWGSGAITYQQCSVPIIQTTKTYTNAEHTAWEINDVELSRDTYYGVPEYHLGPALPESNNPNVTIHQGDEDCVDKTPGSAVTAMLGFKATSEGRIDELQAALSDGIDQVFSAIINQLWRQLAQNLSQGILNLQGDKAAYNEQKQQAYQGLNSAFNGKLNSLLNDYYNPPVQSCTPKTYGTGTSTFIFYPCGNGSSTPVSTGPTLPASDAFFAEKTAAIATINTYKDTEEQYSAIFQTISQMLIEASSSNATSNDFSSTSTGGFAWAQKCNAYFDATDAYGHAQAGYRAQFIPLDVLLNMEGKPANRDVETIHNWNLSDSALQMQLAQANWKIMDDTIKKIVLQDHSASSIQADLESITLGTWDNPNNVSSYVDDAKHWLQAMATIFTPFPADYCVIDISSALNPSI